MISARRRFAPSLVLVTLLGSLLAPACPSATAGRPAAANSPEIAGIRPEGRLRKLHLVRPDLILYPIAYEVYC